MFEFVPSGCSDCYLKKYDQHISVSKPKILAKNIIFGGLYIEAGGEMKARNHTTGDTAIITFYEKQSEKQNSYLVGQILNKEGLKVAELTGSWLDEIHYTNCATG